MTPTITPQEFVDKWSKIQQKESASAQSHFNDVCRLVGHLTPIEYDPSGKNFSFETQAIKPDGQKGFADVFFRDHFIWEYKGPHKDLERAYRQLQLYREALHNPRLLITSDIRTIEIYTNFNNYPTRKHVITFDDILTERGLEILRSAFFDPDKLRPDKTQAQITKATADTFVAVADLMKQYRPLTGETYSDEELAHFLIRLLFSLFAEDMDLLPEGLFTEIVRTQGGSYAELQPVLQDLFTAMRDGGRFGFWKIRHFDGTLFDDAFVPTVPHELGRSLLQAAEQDWAQVDPSIFGTLFERIMDEEKRSQLGAQYTSEDDIMLIVKPVLMEPLEKRWDAVRRQVDRILRQPKSDDTHIDQAYKLLADFSAEIAAIRVLDPASGSGNFLYVSLRELLNLQKKVIAYAARKGLPPIELTVSPEQLYGIEINPYAHELAQITAWIGYLQWLNENGFEVTSDPILKPLKNIKRMDAILAYDENGNPVEPEWPVVEVIIGNPPFLGSRIMRPTFGDDYCDGLQKVYKGRIDGLPDLVCFWFEKTRKQLESGSCARAGLIATNSIRGGANRKVLDNIKSTGDIFMAWDDHPWILDSAAVRVSIIGFDDGSESKRTLNGKNVAALNSDLTSSVDLSHAERLEENSGVAFQGIVLRGPFRLSEKDAKLMMGAENQDNNYENQNVIKLRYNGQDITKRPANIYVIDFGVDTPVEEASKYEEPFDFVRKNVYPMRQEAKQKLARDKWWLHWNPRPEMRSALGELKRYIATPTVSKHRLFKWLDTKIHPDHQLIVFAREDDYFFGVLHSRLHELWALRLGTWLGKGNDPRYTPTTTFVTFSFPWPPGLEPSEEDDKHVSEIAYWARELVAWRDEWLNPPPPPSNVIDTTYKKRLKQRTLTNLYNGLVYFRECKEPGNLWSQDEFEKVTRKSVMRSQIQELDDIHRALDEAVFDAYGWPHDLTDEEILERLLALNLERAATEESELTK